MFKIGSLEIPHRLILAPMCGITHQAFRTICKNYGAGLVTTQMVSAKALTMNDEKSKFLLSFKEMERPIAFQLFGNDPDTLAEAAQIVQGMGPDLIDLNMGCPAKKIVNDGGGSALLRDTSLVKNVFEKMRAVLKIPFTVKMRAGWDKSTMEAFEIAKIAEDCGVDAVSLHARTRAQGYSGKADWSLIKRLKEELSIPVIGNGDVTTLADVNQMLEETGCDAVMIGRAGVSKPWFFKSYLDQKDYEPTMPEIKELVFKQYEAFFDFFGESSGIKQMRKHLCAYTKGVRGGAHFRNQMVTLSDWAPLKEALNNFFNSSEVS